MQTTLAANDLPGPGHMRRLGIVTDQLQDEIGLGRRADIGATAWISTPSAVRELLGPQIVGRPLHLLLAGATQKVQQKNILALEDGVSLELRTPMTVRLLQIQQALPRSLDGLANLLQAVDRLRRRLRISPGGLQDSLQRHLIHSSSTLPRHKNPRTASITDTATAPLEAGRFEQVPGSEFLTCRASYRLCEARSVSITALRLSATLCECLEDTIRA